jgi:diguanylate cyclase (GGDEF)-like protein/PAS domain S-box-containing protein
MGQSATLKYVQPHDTRSNHWLIIGRIIIVAALVSLLLSVLFYLHQQQNLDIARQHEHQEDLQLINTLTSKSGLQLQKFSTLFTSLDGVTNALQTGDRRQIQSVIDTHLNKIQFEWNIDMVGIYAPNNKKIASWSSHPTEEALRKKIAGWVAISNESIKEIKAISCLQTCSQYLIAPLPEEIGHQSVMVISVSLLEILDQFHQTTSKATGLLITPKGTETSDDLLENHWGLALYSLTQPRIYEPILHGFMRDFTPLKGVEQYVRSSIQQKFFELSLHPLSSQEDSMLVIIQDISHTIDGIRNQTLLFALMIFTAVLILTLILYFTLRQLLPHSTYELNEPDITSSKFEITNIDITEIDALYTESDTPLDIDLTNSDEMPIRERLDQLQKYNRRINQELAHQMLVIGQERDQIQKILDNTQTIILTLDKDGKISSINRFGESITGYSSEEIIDKNFIDLYPDHVAYALNDLHTMSSIAEGSQESYRHEARLRCKDGKERSILWLHSSLTNESSTQLLSTGLDITESKQLEKNLSWLADHDSLTSLFNRRRFEKELEDAVLWANKHNALGALLYIDLDNFKDINDSCGHQIGDIILRKVASTMSTLTKDIDASAHLICARLGGDEFAILLRNIDEEGACILSKRILDKFFQIRHEENNFKFQLSCSIGVATFPGMESSSNELLTNADFAMYQAKLLGRNQCYVFTEDDSHREKVNHRLIWREKIETALKNDRFVLHYQPILNIQTRNISHYETLIRMLDDNDELISPGVFINVAERLGLIQEIDHFILRSAIKKQAELLRQGYDVKLAINLSGKAFDDSELTTIVQQTIKENNARAENLIFEITETAAVTDIVSAGKIMAEIQSLGCQFALDDFGVGFSSFYYLRELPVEYVKIDGSFIHDLPANTDNQILVKALSEVAIGFNKLSVAEFVDSLQTLNILSEAKVNFAQGYFIGKPTENIPVKPPNFSQASLAKNTAYR